MKILILILNMNRLSLTFTALLFVAVFPLVLSSQNTAYIPLASTISPSAILALSRMNQTTKHSPDDKENNKKYDKEDK